MFIKCQFLLNLNLHLEKENKKFGKFGLAK